jgi:hypothetical protein
MRKKEKLQRTRIGPDGGMARTCECMRVGHLPLYATTGLQRMGGQVWEDERGSCLLSVRGWENRVRCCESPGKIGAVVVIVVVLVIALD